MHIISSIQFCISSISWCFRQTYNHLWCCSTPFMDFISHVLVDLPVDIKRASLIREVNHERDYAGIRITLSYFENVCHEIAKLACNPNSPSHSRPSRRWYFLHSENCSIKLWSVSIRNACVIQTPFARYGTLTPLCVVVEDYFENIKNGLMQTPSISRKNISLHYPIHLLMSSWLIWGIIFHAYDIDCEVFALSLIAGIMGTTWGPSGAERTEVGPMLAPWTLLSGRLIKYHR